MVAGIADIWRFFRPVTGIRNKVTAACRWVFGIAITAGFCAFVILVHTTNITFPAVSVIPAEAAAFGISVCTVERPGSLNFF